MAEVIHIPSLRASPGVTLSILVDPYADQARLAKLAAAYGCNWTRSFDPADADFAVVATPVSTHHGTALTILEAGKPVLVEKPLTATYAGTEELLNAASENRTRLFCGQVRRYYSNTNTVRRALSMIAPLETVAIFEGNLYGWQRRFHQNTRDENAIRDESVLFDVGSHSIDTLGYILEDLTANWTVESAFADDIDLQSDIEIKASWERPDGAPPVTLRVALSNTTGLANVIWFKGKGGTIMLPVNPAQPAILFPAGDRGDGIRLEPSAVSTTPPHLAMLDSVLLALRSGEASPVDGARVAGTVRFLDAAFRKLEPGDCPWLR